MKLVATLLLACVALVGLATPASAHISSGVKATNDRTEVLGLRPAVKGVTVRLIDAGTRLELTSRGHRVFVLGYDGEDYLRLDHEGVWENVRSPAVYLNQSINGNVPPRLTDPTAPPSWVQISDGDTARWHDHALHVPPGMKIGARNTSTWEREIVVDDQPVKIEGRIVRLPSRSRVPWLVGALAIAVATIVLARRAWSRVVPIVLAVIVVADAARVVGIVVHTPTWLASRLKTITDLSVLSIVGWGMAIAAVVLLSKRRRFESVSAALVSGAVLALSGGVLETKDLSAAILATSLPDVVARSVVTIALGGGIGIALASGMELRRSLLTPTGRAPRSGTAPTQGDGTRTASRSVPPSG